MQLEAAPYVWRLHATDVKAHTGETAHVEQAWLDEHGRLFLQATLDQRAVFGIVHTQDMGAAADLLEQGRWPLQELAFAQMPQRFGYVLNPA